MKRAYLREHGRAGLELIEEAFVLLRTSPLAILATYYLGSVPFAAGLLVFCANLSRPAATSGHLATATLALTALFIWMKFWHARFGATLLARLRGSSPPEWKPGEMLRSLSIQTILQSTALFVLPIAGVIVLPFAWVYAFYQNASVLDDGRTRLGAVCQSAARQSSLWPWQNHVILVVFSGFGFLVFINWITLGFLVPQWVEMFFGIESVFTRSPWSLLNTTFFAAVVALTYLSVDPLIKTAYILRCFYGKSLRSGDDLKMEVRRLSGRGPAWVLGLLLSFISPTLSAAEVTPAPTPAVVSGELDRSIREVIQQGKYTWRSPVEKSVEAKEGLLEGFFKGIVRTIRKISQEIDEFLEKLLKWLFKRDPRSETKPANFDWATPQLGLLFVVLALVAAGLAIATLRILRARRRSASVVSVALAAVPDLEDENTVADELPEDDWTRMGRQSLDQGELRLALRAFYLASLAHLASRGLITIARSKSNRDYERELRRRGHVLPEIPVCFGENVGIFDRVWYGLHEVNPELVQRFVDNLDRMKRTA